MPENIQVEITSPADFHCFRLVLNPKSEDRIEIMLHATGLIDLIHKCSLALCEWQRQTSSHLIQRMTGLTEDEARERGFLA